MIDTPQGVLVFDLDGTISDTSGDIVFSANEVRARAGLSELSPSQVLGNVGHGARFLVSHLIEAGEDDARVTPFLEQFWEHYAEHQTERSRPYPGIESQLLRLAKRYHLYVLSNKSDKAVHIELQKHRLAKYFCRAWGIDGELDEKKPHPEGIFKAMELSKVSADRAAMIGDMAPDYDAGRAAGVRVVWAKWGFGRLDDLAGEPDVIVETVDDLAESVERVFASGARL